MAATGPSICTRSLLMAGVAACLTAATTAAEIDLPTLPPDQVERIDQAVLDQLIAGEGITDTGVTPAYVPEGTPVEDAGVIRTANAMPMGAEGVVIDGAPTAVSGGGSYFNPTLGQHIRARYNTRSYGQEDGNLDLGTMGLWQANGGYGFFDGQVTMNEEQNVGYNLGLGYRWLTLPILPSSPDGAKIAGVSIWADGQGVGAANFFPQVGVSLELLGDRIDLRANGYIPVGPSERTRDFVQVGNDLTFIGNSVAAGTTGILDTPLTVGELEAAGRIGNLDAWIFGGVYAFDGGPYSEVGGKVGLRGYATHDLLLSIAIANDDLFDTNAIFSATWFIGRTRSNNCPTGRLEDRFREPVLRNDYVAVRSDQIAGTAEALTAADGSDLRIVFVDSDAAAGGDGTFENPLNMIDDIAANSQEDDIILLTANSTFSGGAAALQDNQLLLGEGNDFENTVTTATLGTVTLPETFVGASAATRAIIQNSTGAAVTLADGNTVQNITFSGNQVAIASDPTANTGGTIGANLNNLAISGSLDDGIQLTSIARVDADDRDNDSDTTETFNTMGTILIDQVAFDGSVGSDIQIDATSTADDTPAEVISLSNITSTNLGADPSIRIIGTSESAGSQTTIDRFTYTGGAASGGGVSFEMTGAQTFVTNSDFTGGVGPAVNVNANTGTVSVGSSNTIADIAGDAVVITDNEAAVDVDADITTATTVAGGTVRITRNQAAVGLDGDITANNADAVVINDARGQVSFGQAGSEGSIATTGNTGDTVTIIDAGTNTTDPATISFTGDVTNDAGGRVVSITGGDDAVQFNGDVTDAGGGVLVANRLSGAAVDFTGDVALTTTQFDAVTLQNNDEDSSVSFNTANSGSLVIETTSGNGIVGNVGTQGELNVLDNTATGATDSTISTGSGQAIVLADGSSANNVTFDSVTVTNSGAGSAIDLTGFDGSVIVNDGSLQSTTNVVDVNDSGLQLAGVDLTPGAGGTAINVNQTGSTARSVSVSDANLNNGDIAVVSSSSADQLIALDDLTNVDATSFAVASSGTGNLTATLEDVVSSGDISVTTAGDGDAAVTVTSVDSTSQFGAATVQTTDDGDASLIASDVTMSGSLDVDATNDGTATANLTDVTGLTSADVTGINGGGATANLNRVDMAGAFTAAVQNGTGDFDLRDVTGVTNISTQSTGSGNVTTDLTDVTMNGTLVASASGAGNTTLNTNGVTDVTGIDLDSTGSGDITANLDSVTGTGPIALDIAGAGNGRLDLDTVNTDGAVTVNSTAAATGNLTLNSINSGNTTNLAGVTFNNQGDGNASATLTNTRTTNATGLTYTSTGTGSSTLQTTGGFYGTGIDADSTNAGSFTASVINTGLDSGNIDLNAGNTGTVNFTLSNLNYTTGADIDGLAITLGTNVSGGDIRVDNSTGITTQNANAFSLTSTGSGGNPVNFRLSGNTFTNNSATEQTVLVDLAGTQAVNATITSNTATELSGAVTYQFDLATTAGNPQLNLNLAGNTAIASGGGAGSGSIRVGEGAGQVSVFELDDTFNNVGTRNDATIDFDPNDVTQFDDLPNAPVTP